MSTSFDSKAIEEGWIDWWQEAGVHQHNAGKGKAYSVLLPPPNVTGALHIGHALMLAVQDALVRWRRMHGDDVVWIPGFDHAGIATQSVVERQMRLAGRPGRDELGRDAFTQEVHQWASTYRERIREQILRMGALMNWEREFFTLDGPRSAAVASAASALYQKQLLYRGTRFVNWCPALRTAISDIEVDVMQIQGRTQVQVPGGAGGGKRTITLGVMHEFGYPVHTADGTATGEVLRVSTTRLETMLGDVGVAVHPEDPRYAHLLRDGAQVVHPVTGAMLPIVADGTLVDPGLGTGAVKLTPAHDANDAECARRVGLPLHTSLVMDEGGCILHEGALVGTQFAGMNRFDARTALVKYLTEKELFFGESEHSMAVALCSRSGDVLEPRVLPQWYVKTNDMAERSLNMVLPPGGTGGSTSPASLRAESCPAAVPAGRGDGYATVPVVPASPHEGHWEHWLASPQDWCVSRQLWWGHRIPAYYATVPGLHSTGPEAIGTPLEDFSRWVVATSDEQALQDAATKLGVGQEQVQLEQDADVFDTWFSSALLPLSALPGEGGVDSRYYPLSTMETGADILFFWVARMAMLCSELHPAVGTEGTGAAAEHSPFRSVLLHPVVRDKAGRKMSKSLGNVIDPLAVIEGRSMEQLLSPLLQQAEGGGAGGAKGPLLDEKELQRAIDAVRADFPEGIPPCGADALRLTLCGYLTGQHFINMDVGHVVTNWKMGNKLWNAVRFAMDKLHSEEWRAASVGEGGGAATEGGVGDLGVPGHALGGRLEDAPLAAQWVLSRLASTAAECERCMQRFDQGGAAAAAQRFFVGDLCDVYLESAKGLLGGGQSADPADARAAAAARYALAAAMDGALRLLHPFMPFVTEELWQRLQRAGVSGEGVALRHASALATAAWPGSATSDAQGAVPLAAAMNAHVERQMAVVLATAAAARSAAQTAREVSGMGAREVQYVVNTPAGEDLDSGAMQALALVLKCPLGEGRLVQGGEGGGAVPGMSAATDTGITVTVPLPITASAQEKLLAAAAKRESKAGKVGKKLAVLEKRLGSAKYTEAAPADVVQAAQAEAADMRLQVQALQRAAAELRHAAERCRQ